MPMITFIKYPNADAAIIKLKLLKYLSVNIGSDVIVAELVKYPDYQSMLAVSDVLTTLNIENAAYRVEYQNLANVGCLFIANTKMNHGDFIVVNKIHIQKLADTFKNLPAVNL